MHLPGFNPARTLLIGLAISAAVAIPGGSTPAAAQTKKRLRRVSVPFARFAPQSAAFFASARQIDQLDTALGRANVGPHTFSGGLHKGANGPPGFYAALCGLLGERTSIELRELATTRVGVVAPSLAELRRGVWFVRAPDVGAVDRWFPKSRRSAEDRSRHAHTFRTEDGLIICVRERTIAIARRWQNDTLLLDTMRLMSGRSMESLEASAPFQSAHRQLPARPMGTVYMANANTEVTRPGGAVSALPTMSPLAIGIYPRNGRLDFVLHGAMVHPLMRGELAPRTMETTRRLPQTTLLAAAASFNFDEIRERVENAHEPGTLVRYLRLLGRLRGSGRLGVPPLPRIGPQVIGVWDQDLRVGGASPQFALMIECADAERMREEATAIAQNLILGVASVDRSGAGDHLNIELGTHLGTPIASVSLAVFSELSRYPVAPLLADTEPSWAAHDGWLIIALSRLHIERIVDAMLGLSPTLSTTLGGRALWRPRANVRLACIVQSQPASRVLDSWLANMNAGRPSLLEEWWWSGAERRDALRRSRLGIGMNVDAEPGAVVVARVDRGTAADGRLQLQDRVLGIDGFLLALNTPNADMRRRWRQSAAEPGSTLRVRRGDVVMDLTLPRGEISAESYNPTIDAAGIVRDLAEWGRAISAASLVVGASGAKRVAAEVSLHLAPPTPSTTPSPTP